MVIPNYAQSVQTTSAGCGLAADRGGFLPYISAARKNESITVEVIVYNL